MKSTPRVVVLAAALGLASCSASQKHAPVEVLRDIRYATHDGGSLALDVYRPKGAKALPAVIWIHGGGWRSGSRAEAANIEALAARGFVGVSVDHRYSTEAPFPAAVEDVKAAVRWVRAHAAEYGADPDRIGVWGASSGGHLALMVACADETAGPVSSRVQAACAWYAPTDLSNRDLGYALEEIQLFLGATIWSPAAKAASPVTLASADDPPVLLVHGELDILVPPSHSRGMAEALRNAGTKAKLVLVKHARHGFEADGGNPDPSKAEVLELSIDFFEEELK